jgi:hypothetical protein
VRADLEAQAKEQKAAVKAPANYKDEEKIKAFIAEKHAEIDADVDAKWRKTTFDGAYGEICMLAFAIGDSEPFVEDQKSAGSESKLLRWFRDTLEEKIKESERRQTLIIGHNVVDFDLRFIWQRSVIHGMQPPLWLPWHAKPWDDRVFDTMVKWSGVRDRVSLDKLCRVLGIETKGFEIGEDIDGSKVWDFWKAGKIPELRKYVAGDVKRVYEVWKMMSFA